MGMESYSDPLTLASRVAADGDHYALMLGFLRTPPSPLFGSVKKVFRQQLEAENEDEEVAADVLKQSVARLASGVTLTKLSPEPMRPYIIDHYIGDSDYLGSYGRVDLWDVKIKRLGRWKNGGTKYTRDKGILLGRHAQDHSAEDRSRVSPFDSMPVFDGLQAAIATAAAWDAAPADAGKPDLSKPDKAKEWADRIEAARAASQQ